MVNHIRTLLLNKSSRQLELAGFGDGSPWVVDPVFRPSDPEPCVDRVLSAMGGGRSSPSSLSGLSLLADAVSGIVSLADSPDCHHLFAWLDQREVPVREASCRIPAGSPPPSQGTLRGMFWRSPESSMYRGMAVDVEAAGSQALFSRTGSRLVDGILESAGSLYFHPFEWTVRFSAVVAGTVARLEFARTNGAC